MPEARWQVIDRDGCHVGLPFYRRTHAEEEAARLNEQGVEAFRPYSTYDLERATS